LPPAAGHTEKVGLFVENSENIPQKPGLDENKNQKNRYFSGVISERADITKMVI
jgi:hypothetical protein